MKNPLTVLRLARFCLHMMTHSTECPVLIKTHPDEEPIPLRDVLAMVSIEQDALILTTYDARQDCLP